MISNDIGGLEIGITKSRGINSYDIEEVHAARLLVELQVVGDAADCIDEKAIAFLDKSLAEQACTLDDPVRFLICNHEFHTAIYEAGRNRLLADFVADLDTYVMDHRRRVMMQPGAIAQSYREHQAVVEALRRHDRAASVAAFKRHLDRIYDTTKSLMDEERKSERHSAAAEGDGRARGADSGRDALGWSRAAWRQPHQGRSDMKRRMLLSLIAGAGLLAGLGVAAPTPAAAADSKELVYLTPGLDLPFWRYLSKGIESVAKKNGYSYQALDSHNSAQTQLHNAQDAIARGVAGIIISPTDSSTCPSVLELAAKANIPVVIADIGTNSGKYVSFIISDNYKGAYGVGEALAKAMKKKGWDGAPFGIVAISQARKNGQARTKGFMDAMKKAGFTKRAGPAADGLLHGRRDLQVHPGHADVQSRGCGASSSRPTSRRSAPSGPSGRRAGTGRCSSPPSTASPHFVDLLKSGKIVVSGMQQPYLMGERSGEAMVKHLKGGKPAKQILVPILVVTSDNIDEKLPTVKTTVFANEMK